MSFLENQNREFKLLIKTRLLFLSVMLSCLFMPQAGITASAIDLDLLQGIPNVVFLQEDVIGGGVPSQEALEEVKRQGFQSVIDLRTVIEGTLSEQASVKKLGIKYFNIPISSSNISEEQVKRLEEILADPDNKPALLHCAVGGRVNMLWQQYKKEKKDDPVFE